MKRLSIFIFIFWLSPFSVFAQNAALYGTLGKTPCGNFIAWMDGIIQASEKSPDSKIYLVYYGERFRKVDSKTNKKDFEVIKLEYAHRDDGLNWAKAIPFYMANAERVQPELRASLKDKIVLLDGGFRENTEVEIWLVPNAAELPTPTPTVAAKDIKFKTDKPRSVPDFSCCYCGY